MQLQSLGTSLGKPGRNVFFFYFSQESCPLATQFRTFFCQVHSGLPSHQQRCHTPDNSLVNDSIQKRTRWPRRAITTRPRHPKRPDEPKTPLDQPWAATGPQTAGDWADHRQQATRQWPLVYLPPAISATATATAPAPETVCACDAVQYPTTSTATAFQAWHHSMRPTTPTDTPTQAPARRPRSDAAAPTFPTTARTHATCSTRSRSAVHPSPCGTTSRPRAGTRSRWPLRCSLPWVDCLCRAAARL